MDGENLSNSIVGMIQSAVTDIMAKQDFGVIRSRLYDVFGIETADDEVPDAGSTLLLAIAKYNAFMSQLPVDDMRPTIERNVVLKTIDSYWMRHIDNMEQLKQSIRLQAYAQKDPIIEYKLQADAMFDQMIQQIRLDVVRALFHLHVERVQQVSA